MQTALKYAAAIVCFGFGVGFLFAAFVSMNDMNVPVIDMAVRAGIGAMFLLGTFLLLRR